MIKEWLKDWFPVILVGVVLVLAISMSFNTFKEDTPKREACISAGNVWVKTARACALSAGPTP